MPAHSNCLVQNCSISFINTLDILQFALSHQFVSMININAIATLQLHFRRMSYYTFAILAVIAGVVVCSFIWTNDDSKVPMSCSNPLWHRWWLPGNQNWWPATWPEQQADVCCYDNIHTKWSISEGKKYQNVLQCKQRTFENNDWPAK